MDPVVLAPCRRTFAVLICHHAISLLEGHFRKEEQGTWHYIHCGHLIQYVIHIITQYEDPQRNFYFLLWTYVLISYICCNKLP